MSTLLYLYLAVRFHSPFSLCSLWQWHIHCWQEGVERRSWPNECRLQTLQGAT